MKTVYLIGCIKRDVMRWIHKYSPEKKIDLTLWCCGLTSQKDFSAVNKMLNNKGFDDPCYRHWYANDVHAAQEIIGFYVKNGMKNKAPKGGYKSEAKYFYVFKARAQNIDEIVGLLS